MVILNMNWAYFNKTIEIAAANSFYLQNQYWKSNITGTLFPQTTLSLCFHASSALNSDNFVLHLKQDTNQKFALFNQVQNQYKKFITFEHRFKFIGLDTLLGNLKMSPNRYYCSLREKIFFLFSKDEKFHWYISFLESR